MSMQKLKDLAPQIKVIQEKYKGDAQKSSAAMMDLYKKNNANPMGGCLPLLLQMPVFFAIYRMLLNSIALKHSEWILWIDDLSVMDPYFVLPILLGVSMYVQQTITPTTITDPLQKKIFKFLPLIFVFFFMTFPAGLTLYWFVNNVFSIVQQYYINTIFDKRKLLAQEQKNNLKAEKKAKK
jgi:YidC/Oxa1 family membrane protein insertase